MCGLVGLISKSTAGFIHNDVDIFTEMLYADQLRGSHGTGIFFNSALGKKSINTLKAPMKSSEFIAHKKYEDATISIAKNSNFVVGHNRAATRGKLNTECTHPFREKHITLVHNGTLNTQKELHATAEVDSHAICHSMAEIGSAETLKKIDGAFALIWFDSREGTLNLCRNIQRPLNIIETTNFYLICSELELGLWIAKRNNVHVVKNFEVEPRKLYSFKIDGMSKFEVKDVEYKSFTTKSSNDWFGGKYKGKYNDFFDFGDEHKGKETTKTPEIYKIGDKIKFQASHIIFEQNVSYLSCDILVNKDIPQSKRLHVDYEGLKRIRVYAAIEDLRKLMHLKHLEGIVSSTCWTSSGSRYNMRDVRQELNIISNPPALPAAKILDFKGIAPPIHSANEDLCDFCTGKFEDGDVHHHIDGYVLCGVCAADLARTTASVH